MPEWLQYVAGIAALVGPFVSGYLGIRVGQAELRVEVEHAKEEIRMLRHAKHEHANMLTRHEMDIGNLRHKAGMDR
jgi:hypothetical protein